MRRIFWFAIGVGLGAAVAVMLARGLKRARKSIPEAVAGEMRSAIDSFRTTIAEAVEEGRKAMHEAEEEMRAGASEDGE